MRATIIIVITDGHRIEPRDGLIPLTEAHVLSADELAHSGVVLVDVGLEELVELVVGKRRGIKEVLLCICHIEGVKVESGSTAIQGTGDSRQAHGIRTIVRHKHLISQAVLDIVEEGIFPFMLLLLSFKPCQFISKIVVKCLAGFSLRSGDIKHQHMSIIFHTGCTVELHCIEDIRSSLLLLAIEEFEPGFGHLPHNGTIGLTLFDNHLAELLHLPRLLLVDVADKHLTAIIVIDSLLGIVHEVGKQPRQCL